jgi:hypothetical protein
MLGPRPTSLDALEARSEHHEARAPGCPDAHHEAQHHEARVDVADASGLETHREIQRSPRGPRPAWRLTTSPNTTSPASDVPGLEAPREASVRPSPRGVRASILDALEARSEHREARVDATCVRLARTLTTRPSAHREARVRRGQPGQAPRAPARAPTRPASTCPASNLPGCSSRSRRHEPRVDAALVARHRRISVRPLARSARACPPVGARRPRPFARPLARVIRALMRVRSLAASARIHPPTGARHRREFTRPHGVRALSPAL